MTGYRGIRHMLNRDRGKGTEAYESGQATEGLGLRRGTEAYDSGQATEGLGLRRGTEAYDSGHIK